MSKINEMSSAVTPKISMAQARPVQPNERGKELTDHIYTALFYDPKKQPRSPQPMAQAVERILEENSVSEEELMSNLGHVVDYLEHSDEYGSGENSCQSGILTAIHSIKQKREGEAELRPLLAHQEALASLKEGEVWRMAIDGGRQGSGNLYEFDDEAGYYGAICKGLAHVVKTLGEKIDVDSYERLHGICVDQVGKRKKYVIKESQATSVGFKDGEVFDKGYRTLDHEVYFSLSPRRRGKKIQNATERGIAEFEKKYQNDNWVNIMKAVSNKTAKTQWCSLSFRKATSEECEARATIIFDNYHLEIAAAGDDVSLKRRAILRCCQSLTQNHLFFDGNIRTINVMMNKLLIENSLSPAILENPNRLDGYDMDALEQELLVGQAAFQSFCNPPDDLVPTEAQRV